MNYEYPGIAKPFTLYAIAMSVLNIFKRPKSTQLKDTVLQASATLYPDKVLIETVDRVREGFGISSTNISILPVDIDNDTLGITVRQHFSFTRTGLTRPKDYRKHYQDFLTKAGFKNGKEHHASALHLIITQCQDKITLSPTKNGGYTGKDRGFIGIKDSDIILGADIDNAKLADKIKEGWSNCECNCI